ncbi:sensor histidine kinase [Limnochorda pilosa]|uniref:histidine kinase n=1 Tax=Limnochorda pilosa TaxID=1555112 RepID=A0A0K2SGT3_LIMPI|nr:sensor histidine kinase [Limnochorda pilosa]BAS26300.1 hypothetical protein LIP_0443 [Limnochorda pilosa]
MTSRRGLAGPALLAAGVALPALLPHQAFGILPLVREAIELLDSGRLLLAAGALVVLNTVRAVPIYLGAFLTAEAVKTSAHGQARRWLSWLAPLAVIPTAYVLVQWIHGVHYDFGGPAIAGVLAAALVHHMAEATHGRFMRGAILTVFLLGLQWLDVVPALTRHGFGNGELSIEIKLAAGFLQSERLFNLWGLAGFDVFTAIAVLMAKFMVDYRKHLAVIVARQQEELQVARAEARAREEAERNRALVEVQALVHDLKTPLATVSGLASLLGLSLPVASDRRLRAHVSRVERAVATMSQMIAEILSPQAARRVDGHELIRYLRAQLSAVDNPAVGATPSTRQPRPTVFLVTDRLPAVRVNLLRASRALLNVLTNARRAAGPEGRVRVQVAGTSRELRIRVRDWGPGMDAETARRAFEAGFGRSGSSGMGLTFARQVVEGELGGRMTLRSLEGRGTLVVVRFPACREGEADGG